MAEEGSPLLRLGAPTSLSRKKNPGFVPPPPRQQAEHGRTLGLGLADVRQHYSDAVARLPALATDVPYVRIELAPKHRVTDDELLKLNLIPVYRREDHVLAARATDTALHTFGDAVDGYTQLKNKLAVLKKIEVVRPWSKEDRMGQRLKGISIAGQETYTVDLLLMPTHDETPNPGAVATIDAFVRASGGRVLDVVRETTFLAMRVRLGGQSLELLLQYRDDVAIAELPPAAHVVVPEALSLTLDDLPEIGAPSATAPTICVVDSGILEGHPLLEPAILTAKSRSFPPTLGSPTPTDGGGLAGHGTFVAGVALYGDVASCALRRSFSPELRIVNARMLDDNAELTPERMPFLREVVEHARADCRIFNLSFGLEPHEGFLSPYAAELDALAREHDVLFVVSSGNQSQHSAFAAGVPAPGYLDLLADDEWRVLAPAEAFNVLTVGGITPDSGPRDPRSGLEPLVPRRSPSPFARFGGIKNAVKPELVEVAGNYAWDSQLKRSLRNDAGLRVASVSPRVGGLLGYTEGTSVSAPKVSHLAAKLAERYPDASVNLWRALLVQSARRPEGIAELTARSALRVCGFGVKFPRFRGQVDYATC